MKANLSRLAGFLLLGAGAYGAYWYYIAYFADQWVDQLSENLKDSGFELTFDAIETTGFPYRLEIHLMDARWTWRDGPVRVTFTGEDLTIISPPWNRRHLVFQAVSPRFQIQSSTADWIDWSFAPNTISASYRPRDDGGYRFSLVGSDVETGEAGRRGRPIGRASSLEFHVQTIQPDFAVNDRDRILEPELARISFKMEHWSPEGGPQEVELLDMDARIHARFWPRLQQDALENWAAEGSSLEINRLAIYLDGATA